MSRFDDKWIALETKSGQHDSKSGNVERFAMALDAQSGHGGEFYSNVGVKWHEHEMKTTRHETKSGHGGD